MSTAISNQLRRRTSGIAPALWTLVIAAGTLALAAYPMYVIRPFREQEPAALSRALWVVLHDKPILIALVAVIATLTLLIWRRAGWVSRTVLGLSAVLAAIAVAAGWINPEEVMFHPFGQPKYVSAQLAAVDGNDMVIVVTRGGESRAYPIREMGYHHIINDRLHGLPMVVTY